MFRHRWTVRSDSILNVIQIESPSEEYQTIQTHSNAIADLSSPIEIRFMRFQRQRARTAVLQKDDPQMSSEGELLAVICDRRLDSCRTRPFKPLRFRNEMV
jgi:hypothetical protein